MAEIAIDSLSLVQRLALLSVGTAVHEGEDPVDSRAVRERSNRLLNTVDATVVSEPNERDVMRALSALGGQPYVSEQQTEESPAGKGRPTYTLSVGVSSVFDALAEDERLADAVQRVRE